MSARCRWAAAGVLGLFAAVGVSEAGLAQSRVPAASARTSSETEPRPTGAVAPALDYLFFVASEGNDRIALVRFGPAGARVEREHRIGTNPTEPQGPHGLAVDAPANLYYVTTAHGTPNGFLWKFSAADDRQLGRVQLGSFPATAQVAPGGHYVWAVNFNLHGEMVPSSVSVVYGDDMVEVARVPTCVMPHGSRLSPDGSKHYSACMMDDVLVEIDAARMGVARHFMLRAGMEHGMSGPPSAAAMSDHRSAAAPGACSPTWAQPSADGRTVWVACNRSNELVEIDVASWALRRRIPAGDGVYNLAVTRDGRLLLATNKRGQSVSVIDASTGRELGKIPTARRNPSGVAVSSDDRYAFVTVEGVGSEPGTVEVVDLSSYARVASVDIGQQAGGIDFWKTEAPKGR
jgi:YVTN family beta-propeller protein